MKIWVYISGFIYSVLYLVYILAPIQHTPDVQTVALFVEGIFLGIMLSDIVRNDNIPRI